MTSVFEWLFFKTPEKDQLYNWVKSNFTVIDASEKDLDLSKLKIDPSVCFINVKVDDIDSYTGILGENVPIVNTY